MLSVKRWPQLTHAAPTTARPPRPPSVAPELSLRIACFGALSAADHQHAAPRNLNSPTACDWNSAAQECTGALSTVSLQITNGAPNSTGCRVARIDCLSIQTVLNTQLTNAIASGYPIHCYTYNTRSYNIHTTAQRTATGSEYTQLFDTRLHTSLDPPPAHQKISTLPVLWSHKPPHALCQ